MTDTETPRAAEVAVVVERLRAGLAGVTPGPWAHFDGGARASGSLNEVKCSDRCPVVAWSGFDDSFRSAKGHAANANHIANCSPDNIALLLDALAASEALATAMKNERDDALRHNSGKDGVAKAYYENWREAEALATRLKGERDVAIQTLGSIRGHTRETTTATMALGALNAIRSLP